MRTSLNRSLNQRFIKVYSPIVFVSFFIFLEPSQSPPVHLCQTDIEVPDELYDKFSEMPLLFVAQEIPDRDMLEEMKICKEKTSRKTVKGTKTLLCVMKAKKILFYTPVTEWYL